MNVAREMGPGTTFSLAARLVSQPLFWLTNDASSLNQRQVWFLNVAGFPGFWTYFYVGSDWSLHPTFPYGAAVM